MAIGDETREQVDNEVERAAVARVLDLRNVLELIDNRLDERPLAQQEPIGECEELLAHVLAQFRDEPQSVGDQEALSERGGDVALIAKEASKELTDEAWNGLAIVGIARSEAQRQQLASIVDHQMQFEAIEPPHRRLAATRVNSKDAVLRMRAGWQTLSEVESIKLIPEHFPSCVCK